MARQPILSFDRGTLILHPPPPGKDWIDFATWDDRVERFRVPAIHYRALIETLRRTDISLQDRVRAYSELTLLPSLEMIPYPHQQEALTAWQAARSRGVVVLPTAAGKTYLAQLAMQQIQRSTLVVVPTLDLMHQWYAHLHAAFPDVEVGLLGGGSHDRTPILVATYDSAAIHAETLGNQYGLLIFDECHHLPSEFNRAIAEYAIAPYRLGLTATPERSDGKHEDLHWLVGPTVLRKTPEELSGVALAHHKTVQIQVKLSPQERQHYDEQIQIRNQFLQKAQIFLGTLNGWQQFVRESARSSAGRRAMLAHRQARAIAFGTEGKLRVLADLLAQHYPEQTLIFTDDNATVYRISEAFFIPAITHQTPVKERHRILQQFRSGEYPTLVASRVLNEGVDVPAASIAIVLSGTGSTREYIQRLGRILRRGKNPDKLALLYEVVAQDTTEENTARRRRPAKTAPRQLELVPTPLYENPTQSLPRAAEEPKKWD
ncbi:DEAD/DEAH box helicase family protein [Synechococcales cyanobacterium C]|uniref:DNA 3'-5' helicase n=1 Tax=Petrachloros mirabilis ULC683 TaxID=2781853 RepID=A0A8K2A2D9_9CYAN|nr:DEAD/DEAH box helicase family protein [Petrachloros mirabilis]NCJ08641.1 DEAD/DEAH box helicase family protein [Petrachloros mirabilis ULC683]